MPVVLVDNRGALMKTRGGSVFVARNRKALAAIAPAHMHSRLRAVQIDTATKEEGDYWRVPTHNVFLRAGEVTETPFTIRDYMAEREAARTLRELYGLPSVRELSS